MERMSYLFITNKIKGAHWVSLFIDKDTTVYFDSFEIEYIPQDILSKTKNKSVTHNIVIMMILLCVHFIVSLL